MLVIFPQMHLSLDRGREGEDERQLSLTLSRRMDMWAGETTLVGGGGVIGGWGVGVGVGG